MRINTELQHISWANVLAILHNHKQCRESAVFLSIGNGTLARKGDSKFG